MASETVDGLVEWTRSMPSISGAVAQDNEASAHVLFENGFVPIHVRGGEQIDELVLRSVPPRWGTTGPL